MVYDVTKRVKMLINILVVLERVSGIDTNGHRPEQFVFQAIIYLLNVLKLCCRILISEADLVTLSIINDDIKHRDIVNLCDV